MIPITATPAILICTTENISNRSLYLQALLSTCLHIAVAVVQLFGCVRLFATLWTAAHHASLSFTISCSLLKLLSTESVMPSNHLVLWHPLFLQPSIFPSIRVFSNELALCIRWPSIGASASASVLPMNIQD